jgi:hypothetical protein
MSYNLGYIFDQLNKLILFKLYIYKKITHTHIIHQCEAKTLHYQLELNNKIKNNNFFIKELRKNKKL